MTREHFLALLRMQIEQEIRSGVGFWCAPDLKDALRALYARPLTAAADAGGTRAVQVRASNAPAATPGRPAAPSSPIAPPVPSPAVSPAPGEPGSSPVRFARPPAHIAPLTGAGSLPAARSADASASGRSGAGAGRPAARPTWGPPPAAEGRDSDWEKKLKTLEKEALGCTRCPLREGCNSVVFGVGQATVPLVFVGEAPGAEEDRQGIPFVGRAGELLTKIVEAIGLKREQVYICNVLKCRPPGNRDPHPDEVATCSPFLMRQLEILKPKVICTLGRHSTLLLTGESTAMKNVRGQVFDYRGTKVIPTYHPAALLRNPALKPLVWEDVQKVRALLDAQ